MSRADDFTVHEFIEFVARASEALGQQAGVGGMETAGSIISYLADHPHDLEPFLNGGILELPERWFERGRLTWHAQNGKIVRPDVARQSRTIHKLLRQPLPGPPQ